MKMQEKVAIFAAAVSLSFTAQLSNQCRWLNLQTYKKQQNRNYASRNKKFPTVIRTPILKFEIEIHSADLAIIIIFEGRRRMIFISF